MNRLTGKRSDACKQETYTTLGARLDKGLDRPDSGDMFDRSTIAPDLGVELAGIRLQNPVITASGTSGYGPEYTPYLDINALGAFVTKSVTVEERAGNPQPRTVETRGGMLNAIGLANVGLERFCREKVPFLSELKVPVIVNVAGRSKEDYVTVCKRLEETECIAAAEINVSCPNVHDGLEWGTDPGRLEALIGALRPVMRRCRLMVKLTPNVTSISDMARAAINGGADVLTLINTLRAMAIHVETRKPMLANVTGGLSGPAVKPVALAMVHEVFRNVAQPHNIPLIGMGGIANWRDAMEFILAGASAVAVGTALFVNPQTPLHIIDGLNDFLTRQRVNRIRDLVGTVITD